MMEYKITDKVRSLIMHNYGERMNNVLIHTDDQIVHVIKEFDSSAGWHKRIISIGISATSSPDKMIKASFDSKHKLKMLINILQSHLEELE